MFPRRPSSGEGKSDTYEQGAPKRKDEAMPISVHSISPCLWFDGQAEEAANFYVSVFENSRIGSVSRFSEEGYEVHGGKAGSVMTVEFEIRGQTFVALNGGPHFKFNEAVSLQCIATPRKTSITSGKSSARAGRKGLVAG
jgi:hypothetical protein